MAQPCNEPVIVMQLVRKSICMTAAICNPCSHQLLDVMTASTVCVIAFMKIKQCITAQLLVML